MAFGIKSPESSCVWQKLDDGRIHGVRTALSPSVQQLLLCIGLGIPCNQDHDGNISVKVSNQDQGSLITSGMLDLEKANRTLPNMSDFLDLTAYFEAAVQTLAPTFEECENLLSPLTPEEFHQRYSTHLHWTNQNQLLTDCFELLEENKDAKIILSLLLVTGIIERSLGNVFLLNGSQCPALLKDLLASEELQNTLGEPLIQLLHVVLGPPVSMNLRNVAWHGFFSQGELHRRYVYFLLLLTACIEQNLASKGISSDTIPHRDFVSLSGVNEMMHHFPELKCSDLAEVEERVKHSWLVNESNKKIFDLAFECYRVGRYGWCVTQLFPLIEHAFRRLFVEVNQCPNRLLTAQASTFFTTFEEILDRTVNGGKENQVISALGVPCLDFMHDLLIYPQGPRARDKLGHGEADFTSVPVALANLLIYLCVYLAAKPTVDKNDPQKGFMYRIVKRMEKYSSVFHPISLLRQKLSALCQCGGSLHSSINTIPSLNRRGPEDSLEEEFCVNNEAFLHIQYSLKDYVQELIRQVKANSDSTLWEMLQPKLTKPFNFVSEDIKDLLFVNIQTLYRWQKDANVSSTVSESEIVGLLTRIVQEADTCVQQTVTALEVKQEQLHSKQLRSRQRTNLTALLLFMPSLSLYVNFVVSMVTWMFCHLDQYPNLKDKSCQTLRRFLKASLQSCENLRTNTSASQNKWIVAGETINGLVQSALQFSKQEIYPVSNLANR